MFGLKRLLSVASMATRRAIQIRAAAIDEQRAEARGMLRATQVIAGAAIVSLVVAFLQWSTSRAQLQEMSAQRQLTVSQLRANVAAVQVRVDNIESGIPTAKIISKNYGQSAAEHVLIPYRFSFSEYPATHPLPAIGELPSDKIAEVTLMAGQETLSDMASPQGAPLSPEQLARFRDGSYAFYVYGRVKYFDFAGELHVAPFSYIVGGVDKIRDGKGYAYRVDIAPDSQPGKDH